MDVGFPKMQKIVVWEVKMLKRSCNGVLEINKRYRRATFNYVVNSKI